MNRPTFAEKLKRKIEPLYNFEYPTDEQGIIFKHVEGTKIRDYLLAIYELVGGAPNIIAASRVSGGKVILFLASKEIVEDFQSKHGGFQLGNTFIKTRNLKSPSVKIILSNVSPTIPNSVIEETLTKTLKLTLTSPVSILRIAPKDDLFPHIICWRRQLYIHPDTDLTKLPSSFLLNHTDRAYRIFITLDSLTCFKCQKRGHKAEDCPHTTTEDEEEMEDSTNNNLEIERQNITKENLSFPPLPPVPAAHEESHIPSLMQPKLREQNGEHGPKRGASTLTSNTDSQDLPLHDSTQNTDPQVEPKSNVADSQHQVTTKSKNNRNKRRKTSLEANPKSLDLTLEEKSAIINKINSIRDSKYIECDFTAEDFIQFLPATRNRMNRKNLVTTLTFNTTSLLQVLEEIKPVVTAGTKRTISALIKTITQPNSTDQSDRTESE